MNKSGKIFIIIGLLLITAALSLLSYNIWDSDRAGKSSQKIFASLDEAIEESESNFPNNIPYREMPTIEIDGYEYIGTLSIPYLDLDLPIMAEWDYQRLMIAPCLFNGSVYQNNMVIAAHNYASHFGYIKNLPVDTDIYFKDCENNEYHYKLGWIESLSPDMEEQMTIKTTKNDWDLTLFTCTYDGTKRITVRCYRVEDKI